MPLLGILKKYTDTVSEDHSYTWIRSTEIYYILLQCLQQNKVTISYPSSCSISAPIYSKPGSGVAKSWASRTAESVISVLSSFKKFQNNHKTIPLCWCCWSVSDLYNTSNFRWVKVFGWVAPLMSDLSHLISLYILPWLWGLVKKFLTKNLLALTATGISHVSSLEKRVSLELLDRKCNLQSVPAMCPSSSYYPQLAFCPCLNTEPAQWSKNKTSLITFFQNTS